MKFLILGSTGMAGHVIFHYLQEQGYNVTALSRRKIYPHTNIILDVGCQNELLEIISTGKYDFVVNCVGILNQSAEKYKTLAIKLNSGLPHFLAEITADTDTKIIHLSTDCVFSGNRGGYTENDFPDGKTFYDRTKALGELIDDKNITFRNSIIGPDLESDGIGLLNWFVQQKCEIQGYTKSVWSGVTTLFLAQMIEKAALENICGLYHLTNNSTITKFEILNLFREIFGRDIKISPTEGVIADKSLINTKNFGIAPTYKQMFQEMKFWISDHKNFYPKYYFDENFY